LLKSRIPNFTFAATAGLSLGEFTALAAAGVMSFEDGLATVRERGRFMQEACETTSGAMAAIIALDETVTRGICQEAGVELANLNCPGQLVISGDAEKIAKACELARQKGAKKAVTIPVAGAYHSRLMASAQPKLRRTLASLTLLPPSVTVISNVTAEPHGSPDKIVDGLVQQVTSSVRWEESIRYLLARGVARFIEFGPGTALTGFLKRIDDTVVRLNVADAASLESTVRALAD
jgi:[acyl-carrier-protein] S-malonyltransferase